MESKPAGEQPATKQARAVEAGRKEERCCAVYEEAVKTLPTGELRQTAVCYRSGGSIHKWETEASVPINRNQFSGISAVVDSVPGFPTCSLVVKDGDFRTFLASSDVYVHLFEGDDT